MQREAVILFVFVLGHANLVAAREPVWTLDIVQSNQAVTVIPSVRYGGCGSASRLVRIDQFTGQEVEVWSSLEFKIAEEDIFVDCQCEKTGTFSGTTMKNCPQQSCLPDEACVCSQRCSDIIEKCVPSGNHTYRLFTQHNPDNPAASIDVFVDYAGQDCTPKYDGKQSDESKSSDSNGGCSLSQGKEVTYHCWLVLFLLFALIKLAMTRTKQHCNKGLQG